MGKEKKKRKKKKSGRIGEVQREDNARASTIPFENPNFLKLPVCNLKNTIERKKMLRKIIFLCLISS